MIPSGHNLSQIFFVAHHPFVQLYSWNSSACLNQINILSTTGDKKIKWAVKLKNSNHDVITCLYIEKGTASVGLVIGVKPHATCCLKVSIMGFDYAHHNHGVILYYQVVYLVNVYVTLLVDTAQMFDRYTCLLNQLFFQL